MLADQRRSTVGLLVAHHRNAALHRWAGCIVALSHARIRPAWLTATCWLVRSPSWRRLWLNRAFEPACTKALEQLRDDAGLRVLDVGCGAMGWLRIHSQWVGGDGTVVGSDTDPNLLQG
jgi:2-polyprenyl-3-methyl-5-hydroxy-6-metoxy-1,4-benzoquinol methylase